MLSLIVGLGNPGEKYYNTRHNLGFEVLDLICRLWKIKPKEEISNYCLAEKKIEGEKVRLLWPTTYMNRSGLAVKDALERLKLSPENILVIYDDFELPLGKLRIRSKGSAGFHNGMGSIIESFGTENILRLRIGCGPLPENIDPVDFVLGRFSENERLIVKKSLDIAAEAVVYLLKNRPEEAMTKYNINPAPETD